MQHPTLAIDPRRYLGVWPHRQLRTRHDVLDSRAALSNSYPKAYVPSRETVCTILIMVFGMIRMGREPATYCMGDGHPYHYQSKLDAVHKHVYNIYCFFWFNGAFYLNIWGLITTVPACSSGTLTKVLPHRNVMLQRQDTTTHPVTVYRHGADLSLYYSYSLKWIATLDYRAIHFGWDPTGWSFPNLPHTPANAQL